jgi:alpha-amylase/alpha-mannosidase (GH57 family)
MQRYLCIHGHFYQPPRENPWLEAIEIQDSAHPYHDWNERITAECYAPNSVTRKLDAEGRILDILSNYSRVSFNFGPTLLSWMETNAQDVYQAILDSDAQSIEWRSGHGNALAQAYSHLIMPLANKMDKRTQVIWGIRDFEYRFKRFPEGMWLPETAVDLESLEILAESGIQFTILAPRQAAKTRKIGTGKWKDVSNSKIDPTMPYLCRLPSGRSIRLFFYDGPISQGVAFEYLLKNGEDFAHRLLSGFSESRTWPQILHIATDGETYGHHQKFGDMGLAGALDYIESQGLARITNYGEYLSMYPPTHEVQVIENSSWSCIHGIERWRSDCGCHSGRHQGWHQGWREPLRESLDWLRERLINIYNNHAGAYLKDPWKAREEYIRAILNRTAETMDRFLEDHAVRVLNGEDRIVAIKLLEMQRHAMLMYTSCGWFFDELSGLETVQVLQYAGRAIQLSDDIFPDGLEDAFRLRLSLAKSNIPEIDNGDRIYERYVKPAMLDFNKVAAHYAVSSIFEDYGDEANIYSYRVKKEDYLKVPAGGTTLGIGRVSVISDITGKSGQISFCTLHFGGHALNGGVRTFISPEAYQSMKNEIFSTFEKGDFADIIRLMDRHFGTHNYSIKNLFRDQQRVVVNSLIARTLEEFENAYRQIYENNRILMAFLIETAEFTLNYDIQRAFAEDILDVDRIRFLIDEMKKWQIPIDTVDLEFAIRHKLEDMMEMLFENPSDLEFLFKIQKMLEVLKLLPVTVRYWKVQNIYYRIAKAAYSDILSKAKAGDKEAASWIGTFKYMGEILFFQIESVLPSE